MIYRQRYSFLDTYSLRGAGKTELVSDSVVSVVGVSLEKVGHAVLGAPAVDHLLAGVVRVHDVGPGHVTEITAFLQFFNWLTNLRNTKFSIKWKCSCQ